MTMVENYSFHVVSNAAEWIKLTPLQGYRFMILYPLGMPGTP